MKEKRHRVSGVLVAFVIMLFAGMAMMSGCAGTNTAPSGSGDAAASQPIHAISREDGSGTRSAFVELFGVEVENSEGKKVDATTSAAVITNSTSVMLTSVSGDRAAIGYISLGSLNDTVKAVEINGSAATAENIKTGSYPIQRPFNIATQNNLSEQAQDFIKFIFSREGQQVVEDNLYIAIDNNAPAFTPGNVEGKISVAGSSSVSPVMEKLKEAYEAINPKVSIEIQTTDSSTGMSSTIGGICDIGMASRDLKESELSAGLTPQEIALDGIAVIVNNENAVQNLTIEQVRAIFLGEFTNWSDINA